jgi:cytoskeleton protein RodZ
MTDTQPGPLSAGALLRAAREKQGLHIAALAAAIKVAPRKLDALENDRWQDLPDATFTRALAQTVCRTLKIDARPILALLPAPAALPLEPPGNTMNEPFRDRPGRDGSGFGTGAIRPMIWAAAVLMVAALVVYFAPPELWTTKSPPVVAITPVMPSAASAALPAPAEGASTHVLARRFFQHRRQPPPRHQRPSAWYSSAAAKPRGWMRATGVATCCCRAPFSPVKAWA